jgi:hypothetical protein
MTSAPSFVAIDPGYAKRGGGCAVAAFQFGRLNAAFFDRPEKWRGMPFPLDFVLVEQPQYEGGTTGRSTKCNPATLMQLSWEGALLAGMYAASHFTPGKVIAKTPRRWKGSTPKPVQHAALWAVLSLEETRILGGVTTGLAIELACEKGALDRWSKPGVEYYPSAFVTHNLLDAVAMGCKHIGRLML